MADDIYVLVKGMKVKSGAVSKEHGKNAEKIMCDAAVKALNKGSGVKADMKPDKKKTGFMLSATLNAVNVDEQKKQVSCEVSGGVYLWPEDKLVAPGLSSKPKIMGEFDQRAVEDCIAIAIESVVKEKVLAALKTLSKKHDR